MRKILFIFALLGAGIVQGNSQEVLSLEECLNIGIENNLSLQTKRNDMEKGKYTLSENRARLLPQINGFANFNDNIDPPVSVTDGVLSGCHTMSHRHQVYGECRNSVADAALQPDPLYGSFHCPYHRPYEPSELRKGA